MAEKQKANIARTKEIERIKQEELLKNKGCPIKRFFEHIAKITAERIETANDLRNATLF